MKTISPRKVEVKIERPNGEVETITHPKIDYMTGGIFSQMNKAMKDAGRGVCLSYRNIEAVVEMEESDYQGRCERCSASLDTRKAYSQKEWSYFGGKRVQVTACYCNSCEQVLTTVGAGEVTPMEERATEKPSYEAYKGEADT